MNQDTVRNILAKFDPDQLYQFFHRSTELRKCEEANNAVTEDKKRAQLLLQEAIHVVQDLEKVSFFTSLKGVCCTVSFFKSNYVAGISKVEEEQGMSRVSGQKGQ